MIDTDKYEGHTPAPWNIRDDIMILGGHRGFDYIAQVGVDEDYNDIPQIRKNAQLIADAPKLLAEVKRLRGRLEVIEDFINDELRAFVNSNTFDRIYDTIERKLEVKE